MPIEGCLGGAAYSESHLEGMGVGAHLPISSPQLFWGSSSAFPRPQPAGLVEKRSHVQMKAVGGGSGAYEREGGGRLKGVSLAILRAKRLVTGAPSWS